MSNKSNAADAIWPPFIEGIDEIADEREEDGDIRGATFCRKVAARLRDVQRERRIAQAGEYSKALFSYHDNGLTSGSPANTGWRVDPPSVEQIKDGIRKAADHNPARRDGAGRTKPWDGPTYDKNGL